MNINLLAPLTAVYQSHSLFNNDLLKIRFSLLILLGAFSLPQIHAQQSVEFIGAASGPTTSGPTANSQVITFYANATTPSSPPITATFTYSNQQFASVEGNPSVPGATFGTSVQSGAAAAQNLPVSNPTYDLMNVISGPMDNNFTACASCPTGTGISVTTNRAVALFNSSDALINSTGTNLFPLTARVRYTDLTITFNRPVNNPILHIVGLGGNFSYTTNPGTANSISYIIGFTTELDLLTSGVSLTKLSGNAAMTVSPTSITNNATNYGATTTPATLQGVVRSAATGSVVINGIGITSVSFRVYLKGDGGTVRDINNVAIPPANGNNIMWSTQLNFVPNNGGGGTLNAFSGDKYLMGMSLQPCPQIINPSAGQTICQGGSGSNITVNTDTNGANSIRFVRFSSDQMAGSTPTPAEAAAIYAGTPIATVTPTGTAEPYLATYNFNTADFPNPGTYYVYAILNPNPGGDCYPVREIPVTVNQPATVVAGGPDNVCQSATPTPIPLTGASVGGGATTAAWSIISGGGTLSSMAQTANPAAVTYTPAANFSGTVSLQLTTNDPAGACPSVSAIRTITILKVDCGEFPWNGSN